MKKIGEPCEICGRFVKGFKYEKCCDGIDCNCRGEIQGVCLCSEKCGETYDKIVELENGRDKHLGNWLKLKAEIENHNCLIKLQHKRTVEASRLWQKAHGKSELEFPDLGELIEWLIKEAGL